MQRSEICGIAISAALMLDVWYKNGWQVKCRSMGKYQILKPPAKGLVKDGHDKIDVEDSEINYRDIARRQVKRITEVERCPYYSQRRLRKRTVF